MHTIESPTVRVLDEREAADLLARNHVGRVAFSWHDRVDIAPVNYVYDAPWIFGRTSAGAKLLSLGHNHWCAFEVDEVRGPFDWESVVAKGPFSPHGSVFASWDLDRAVAALRRFLPSTLGADDPTPERDVIFGIHVSEITGRRSVGGARS
jgi:nitroimidazol reductase NimA-like FMN-containing flavoprotein (pyridoxamine 5'-phosphate oxidase superfamily)